MATRTVSGLLKKADGSAWTGAEVRFRLWPGAYRASPAETYPPQTLVVVTDSSGTFSTALISGDGILYRVTLPGEETFDIAVPDGSATTLAALRASYAGAPVAIATVEAALLALYGSPPTGRPALVVQEDDTTKVTEAATIDFGTALNVTESPTGEANVSVDLGTASTQAAAGNHGHTFGTSAGTYAEGNHTHAAAAAPVQTASLTIASDAITLPTVPSTTAHIVVTVDTEGAAAADNLSTVNVTGSVADGTLLIIHSTASTRDVTCKHNVGNLVNRPSTDAILGAASDGITYQRSGSSWWEISRAIS